MGCGASSSGEGSFVNLCKSEERLVSLCKERKDLIKAARDCRYALAESHVLYLQSLLDVSKALNEFVRDAAMVSVDSPSCSSVSDSPLHSDDGSHLELSSVDSESVFLGSLTDEVHQEEKDQKSKLASPRPSVESLGNGKNVSYIVRSPTEAVSVMHEPAREFSASVAEDYVPNMPPMYHHPDGFVHNNYWFPADRTASYTGGQTDAHYNGYIFSDYRNRPSSSHPVNSSVYGNGIGEDISGRHMGYFGGMPQEYQPHAHPQPSPNPIPSPPMADSNMDYFNLFDVTDDFYSKYYSRNIFGDGLGSEYSNLNDLREEEGIPPLEEIEEDTPNATSNSSEAVRDSHADESNDTSDERMTEGYKYPNQNSQEEEFPRDNTSSTDSVEKQARKKEVNSSSGGDKIVNEGEPCSQMNEAVTPRDILAAMLEISHSFSAAYTSGLEVTGILEAGKFPYLSMGSVLKGFYLRILGALAPSTVSLQTTYMLRKQLVHKIRKMTNHESSHLMKDNSHRLGAMSSTLDKLYTWEKKLYKEVKIEESHRAVYDKLCKRSKMLTNKGAESDKIEAVQAKIRNLLPKLDVSVSAMSAISRRIQLARDEELRPQICALIHGLSRMWKSMSQCHQAQVDATAVDSKERHDVVRMELLMDLNRTEELKLQTLRWRSRFCEMVKTQRAFAAFLAEWLSKFLREEVIETEDGLTPVSPGTIGAPAIFLSCHDWLHALDATPVSSASEALQEFALALHKLWAKQNEERGLRLRIEFLEGWITSTSSAGGSRSEARDAEVLKNARRNLEELKLVHAGVCDEAKSAASSCLEDGLVEALKALESVCTEMSKAYDQIRI